MTRSERRAARIAVDLLGGDDSPAVVVDGALLAVGADPHLHLHLIGPVEVVEQVRSALPEGDRARVSAHPVRHAIGPADQAVRAVRGESTVRAAVAAVAHGEADGAVSAGSTGALVTAAAVMLGRLPGVRRPALAATLPAVEGPVLLLDVGASVDCGVPGLVGHAMLGVEYARTVLGLVEPRVGLLSIGTEHGKGDRLRRAADAALADTALAEAGYRYVGNVEGYEVATGGRADVVVTDGFTGNVLLKGIEGAFTLAGGRMPRHRAPRAAALLGVAGTVVACHGAADASDIASGIALAARLCRVDVVSPRGTGDAAPVDPLEVS
ncbi:MAG TPA: phosphate acyltransferase PlsX [Micromonosporaceae bacterium]